MYGLFFRFCRFNEAPAVEEERNGVHALSDQSSPTRSPLHSIYVQERLSTGCSLTRD